MRLQTYSPSGPSSSFPHFSLKPLVQRGTSIPIPRAAAWSSTATSCVGVAMTPRRARSAVSPVRAPGKAPAALSFSNRSETRLFPVPVVPPMTCSGSGFLEPSTQAPISYIVAVHSSADRRGSCFLVSRVMSGFVGRHQHVKGAGELDGTGFDRRHARHCDLAGLHLLYGLLGPPVIVLRVARAGNRSEARSIVRLTGTSSASNPLSNSARAVARMISCREAPGARSGDRVFGDVADSSSPRIPGSHWRSRRTGPQV